jgi:hypothetical protein
MVPNDNHLAWLDPAFGERDSTSCTYIKKSRKGVWID